jgi:hypothetical protein
MKTLDDGPEKQALIDRMVALVQQDAPWTFWLLPLHLGAAQRWVHNYKPAILIRDHGRYLRLDVPTAWRRWPRGTGRCGGRWLLAIAAAGAGWLGWRARSLRRASAPTRAAW